MANTTRLRMGKFVRNYQYFLYLFLIIQGWGQTDSTIFDQEIQEFKQNISKTSMIGATVNPINVLPTAYRFSIYPRNRPAEIQIQKIFFPGEQILIELPADILSSKPLGNIAKLEPMGDNYIVQYRMFDAKVGQIQLTPFQVNAPMDIVKLYVLDAQTKEPIPESKIIVSQEGKILTSLQTNAFGYSRVGIPKKRKMGEPVLFSIDTNENYPPWKGWMYISEETLEKVVYISSLVPDSGEVLYTIKQDFVPFRAGPENGAEVQFILIKNEQIAVSKVAGDRLYGRMNIFIESKQAYQNVYGWVLGKFVSRKSKL